VIYTPAVKMKQEMANGQSMSVNLPVAQTRAESIDDMMGKRLSHRARKQIYMSSSILDPQGPRGETIYDPSRQKGVYGNVMMSMNHVQKAPDMQLPCPADFRATVNAGHGVVGPSARNINGFGDAVSFGGGPDVPIVHAARDKESIPREFWATTSTLNWMDTRAEHCGAHRLQESRKPAATSADARKRRDLSSEIFGNERLMHKTSSVPSKEIWSQPDNDFSVHGTPRTRTRNTQGPLNASERLSKNLSTSSENQLAKYPEIRKSAASESPGPRRQRGRKDEDDSFKDRRRAERNYSDLFGNQAAAPIKTPRRQEFHGTSNCSFLDHQAEISTRNATGWRAIAPATPREASESKVLPIGERRKQSLTAEEKAIRQEERACWDTASIMESNSEIARRMRQSRADSAGRRDVASANQQRSSSASERKRLDLASGQFRHSNAIEPKSWDDGRAGPGPAPSPRRRDASVSPHTSWRNVGADTAKQRRIVSLMSSISLG